MEKAGTKMQEKTLKGQKHDISMKSRLEYSSMGLYTKIIFDT